MTSLKKYYFLSDAHLGIPDYHSSLIREKKLVKWLDSVKEDAGGIFLLGDIFDFWFEYQNVVPKYFVRLLGKIAELTDAGIPVWFFKGNHDMWTYGYLEKEIGVKVISNHLEIQLGDKHFYLAHGDGLGPDDHGYKAVKSVFTSNTARKLFATLHPRIAFTLAGYSSQKSRKAHIATDRHFADEKEILIRFARETLKNKHFDYFVFGHRHVPVRKDLTSESTIVTLGDWVTHLTYAVFDGNMIELKTFENELPH